MRTWTNCSANRAFRLIGRSAKRFMKLSRLLLDDEAIIYLYHSRVLIAHTARLEGYRQLPDGMVRVVGLTLK